MKYSRYALNKAGEVLIDLQSDPFKYSESLKIVSDWRETHLPVLRKLNNDLLNLFQTKSIEYSFSSQRIKRMTSILEKLKNNASKGMCLGGLQDIGGIRFVFENKNDLEKAFEILNDYTPTDFEKKKINDYITEPKCSGYRSIHFVYKHKSEDSIYDGLQIELQIRTRLQHSWAMAVETASLISRTSLKADLNDGSDWRNFFKLISAIFAKKENAPVNSAFENYTTNQLCKEYFQFKKMQLPDTLRALRVTVNNDKIQECIDGYCVLSIDFIKQVVSIKTFTSDCEKIASETFTDIEKIIDNNKAVIMVSIAKIQELKEAYPSYFLDSNDFLKSLQEFEDKCNNCSLN